MAVWFARLSKRVLGVPNLLVLNINDKLMERRSTCPSCGGSDVSRKASVCVKTINAEVPLLRCKSCGHRFRSMVIANRRQAHPPQDLVENYFNFESINAMKHGLNLPVSVSTVHRWLVNGLNDYPGWEDQLSDSSAKWSNIMGLDMTGIKIGGKLCNYLHIADFPNNHLAYEILEKRDATRVKTILMKIRSLGYYPLITVMDLARELLLAVREIYPTTMIQGCLFHLMMWLDKRLPTKNIRLIDPRKAAVWNNAKYAIFKVASSKSQEERRKSIEELKNLTASIEDKRVKLVVNDFLRNLKYYHILDELTLLGCREEWRYNNVCERAMKSVKDLGNKMYGFKTIEHARMYINAMWAIKRKNENEKNVKHDTQKQSLVQETIPFFVDNYLIDLTQVADAINVNINMLKEQVERQGFIVTNRMAFKKSYLETVREKILRERPKTISDIVRITGVDP